MDFQKILDNIAKFGCNVFHIFEEGDSPPFSYSAGIWQTSAAPEVVVIGLKRELSHSIVNEYNRRVRTGERFVPGQRYAGFIGGFDIQIAKVDTSFYDEYFGQCQRLYEGDGFEVVQIVYPNTSGVWPWEYEASEAFKARQPLLAHTRH